MSQAINQIMELRITLGWVPQWPWPSSHVCWPWPQHWCNFVLVTQTCHGFRTWGAKHVRSECPDDVGVTDRRNNQPWQNNMSHILWADSRQEGYFVWAVSYLTWKNKSCCKHDINVRIQSWELAGESYCVFVDYLSVVFFSVVFFRQDVEQGGLEWNSVVRWLSHWACLRS